MSEQSKSARPSQVTMAGWVAASGSALLVLTLFDSVSRLRTVEFRDAVDEFLSTPPGNGLGLEIPQVVEILRGLMFFSGAAAAAATVLAIYALQRHNAARIGFTVAAVAIMLTAPVAGGFLPVMIGFAAIMLWTRPARDWFAGRPVTQPTAAREVFAAGRRDPRAQGRLLSSQDRPSDGSGPPAPGPGADPGDPEAGDPGPGEPPPPRMPEGSSGHPVPPPTSGFGTPGGQPAQAWPETGPQAGPGGQPGSGQPGAPGYPPPPYGQPGGYPYGRQGPGPYPPQYYPGPAGAGGPGQRPTTVTVAAWITWALSALTMVGFVLIGVVMAVARDEFLRQLARDPSFQALDVPTGQVVAALWVIGAVALFWAAAAIVLAWFAFRRAGWARIALVVSAASTVLFSLVTFPVGILHTLGAGAVITLLFSGGANQWYARRTGQQGPPGGFAPYPPHPGGQQYGAPPGRPVPGHPDQPVGPPTARPADQPREEPRGRGKDEPPSNVW